MMNITETEFLNTSVLESLKTWGFQSHLPKFFCADGYVIAALLCNAAAKFINPDFYDCKSHIIRKAVEEHNNCWQSEGVIYFETSVGQISFHVFEGEGNLLPDSNGRQWEGGWMQDECVKIAEAFISDDPIVAWSFDRWISEVQ